MSARPSRQLDRRGFARRAAGMCLAALLSACSSPSQTTTPPAQTIANPITLLLWHGWSGAARQVLGQQVEHFNRQSQSGRILLQPVPLASLGSELRSAAIAGSGPHVALIPSTWVGGLAQEQILLPVDDQVPDETRRAFLPASIATAQILGSDARQVLYGLPISFDTLALFYNSANLLTPPADTTALLSSARGLSAPDANPPIWGFAINLSLDTMIGYLYAFGGQIFDPKGAIVLGSTGRAGTERWLNWVHELSVDKRILARPESSIAVDSELRSGRALATFDWAHQLSVYRALWGERMGIAPIPLLAETSQPAQAYIRSDVLTINARATGQERAAAQAFLRFMATEDVHLALLRADLQPTRAIPLADTEPTSIAARAFRSQAEHGRPMPNLPERNAISQELRFMLQQVLSGFTSPADAITDADKRLRLRLNQ